MSYSSHSASSSVVDSTSKSTAYAPRRRKRSVQRRPRSNPAERKDNTARSRKRPVHRRRRTPSCTACAAAKTRCVGRLPCSRCKSRGAAAAKKCTPVAWPSRSQQRMGSTTQDEPATTAATTTEETFDDLDSASSNTKSDENYGPSPTNSAHESSASPSYQARSATTDPSESGDCMLGATFQQTGQRGEAMLPWDPVPFSDQGKAWVNTLLAQWLGYAPDAAGSAFQSIGGLRCVMEPSSVITFLGAMFRALDNDDSKFDCPVTLRRSDGSLLSSQCEGSIQYAPNKSIFLQFSLTESGASPQAPSPTPMRFTSDHPNKSSTDMAAGLPPRTTTCSSWVMNHDPDPYMCDVECRAADNMFTDQLLK